jgi:hypothetical protein
MDGTLVPVNDLCSAKSLCRIGEHDMPRSAQRRRCAAAIRAFPSLVFGPVDKPPATMNSNMNVSASFATGGSGGSPVSSARTITPAARVPAPALIAPR